jgi:hypothetical protein
MSKITAKSNKNNALLTGHTTQSDPMFLNKTWLQKLSIKVQVLNANLVSMFVRYGDAYDAKPPALNACPLVHRAVAARQSQIGSTHGR